MFHVELQGRLRVQSHGEFRQSRLRPKIVGLIIPIFQYSPCQGYVLRVGEEEEQQIIARARRMDGSIQALCGHGNLFRW